MPSDDVPPSSGEGEPPTSEVHRLHPLSLLFRMGGALRGLFIPLVFFVFFSSGGENLAWIAWAFGVSMVYAVVKYLTCRYRLAVDELVVTGGFLFRFERHIPYERIQNIDLSQSVLQRALRVADVKIETASGSEAEANLQVLSLDAVEQMRRHVFADRAPEEMAGKPTGAASEESVEQVVLLHLGARDLVAFGLLSNRGMAVVLAALGLAYEFDIVSEERIEQLGKLDHLPLESLPGWGADGPAWPLLAALGGLAALMLLRLLSVLWAFWKLHGFTLVRSGDDLRTSCGLFTRLTATIPRKRIQAITVTEGWLHRRLGLAAVKVDTAGGSELENQAATRSWVAPLIAVERLDDLLEQLQPGLSLGNVRWRPVASCGRVRLARRRCAMLLLLGAGAAWWWTPWVLVSLPFLWILAAWEAGKRVAVLGYGLDETGFAARRGLWTRTTRLLRYSRVQVLDRRESPFDRRWGTVTLGLDIAGTDTAIRVPFLAAEVAHGLHDELAKRAGSLADPRQIS